MTVSRLRTELTDAELIYYAAYFSLKGEEQERIQQRNRMRR
jgi:hypothetical protein